MRADRSPNRYPYRNVEASRRGGEEATSGDTSFSSVSICAIAKVNHYYFIILFVLFSILEIAPAAIALFPKFKDVPASQREQDENYRKHSYTVVDAIGLAVSFLDDLDTLEGVLCDLGSTHAKYGIQNEHFEVLINQH